MAAIFPILETLLKRTFWYRQQLSSIVTKRFPFIREFSFGNRKAGAKSGGSLKVTVLFLAKNSRKTIDV